MNERGCYALLFFAIGIYDFYVAIKQQRRLHKPNWVFYGLGTLFCAAGLIVGVEALILAEHSR